MYGRPQATVGSSERFVGLAELYVEVNATTNFSTSQAAQLASCGVTAYTVSTINMQFTPLGDQLMSTSLVHIHV